MTLPEFFNCRITRERKTENVPIIDFHTHAFPDDVAERAIKVLQKKATVKAHHDGKISSLLRSMDRNDIEKSVVCSIATRPEQFDPIITWSKGIRSERIVPLPSVHPRDPLCHDRLRKVRGEGFRGIKLHPYYQDFCLDEEAMFPLYERLCEENLLLVVHTGYDIGFPRIEKAGPRSILAVTKAFPDLRLVTTHFGSWDQWEEVEEVMAGRRIWMEISFAFEYMEGSRARSILEKYLPGYVLFGSDSPWSDQGETLSRLRACGLGRDRERMIMGDNAARLLGMESN